MNLAPLNPSSFPVALFSLRDGSLLELRNVRGEILLVAERAGGVRGSTQLSHEQAATLSTFKYPNNDRRAPEEIERKWRPIQSEHLKAIADLESTAVKFSEIQQGYLCLGEDEARLRRKGESYLLTLKSGGVLSRREVEIDLTAAQCNDLWHVTVGQRLEKVRSVVEIPQPDGVFARVEIDRFRGRHAPLVLVECEFSSLDDATRFEAPPYFGDEVTTDSQYKNRSLASGDLPGAPSLDGDLPNMR